MTALPTQTENLNDSILAQASQGLEINPPRLQFQKCRWNEIGRLNREQLEDLFEQDRFLVKEIADPKFAPYSYVLMRKDTLESLYRLVEDLAVGQIGVQQDYEVISELTIGIKEYAQTEGKEGLVSLVSALQKLIIQSTSRFVRTAKQQPYVSAPLSPEELAELEEEDY